MGPKRAGGHGHGGGGHHEERHDDEGPALAHRPKARKDQEEEEEDNDENDVVKRGVYIVRHVQSKSCLGVQDGEWEMGEVECRPVNEVNTNPLDLTYERFLVWPNKPGKAECWNLLNLRAGAYVIHNAAEKGSKSIRSKATNAQSPEALWDIEEVEGPGSIYRFRPHGDKKHFLSVDDPKDSKSTAILVDPENENKDKGILFKLEATDMGQHKIASWMKMADPQTRLSMMSIPGTHQTLALNTAGKRMFNSDNPHCQNLSPYLQLCAGMRFFDLRLNYYDWEDAKNNKGHRDGLIARHGVHPVAFVWEGYSFSALCQSVAAFLKDHPKETVFLLAKQEGEVEGLSPKKLADTFYDELKPWTRYFKQFEKKEAFVDLTMKDVAGKAVIFTGVFRGGIKVKDKTDVFPPPNNNYVTFWLPHGHQKVVALEGPPEQLTVSQFPEHAKRMTEFLKKVAESDDPNTLFWLGLNSSGKPAISGAAMGELYNPIDYTKWINKDFLPPHIDEKRHPKGTRMGLVTFDFVELAAPFVKFLVERNPGVEV